MKFPSDEGGKMFRIEFLVEDAKLGRGTFTATAASIDEAKLLVPADLQIVKTLCMIDLQPQVFLAW